MKRVCDKILADENAHIRYESEILNHIRSGKAAPIRKAIVRLHAFLQLATIIVVYGSHKSVLNRGGYDFTRFFADCWLEFSDRFVPSAVVRAAAGRARDAGPSEA